MVFENEFDEKGKAVECAKEFVMQKVRQNYYEVTAFDDQYCSEVVYINEISPEKVDAIKALREKYGEEYVKHLKEVYDDEDELYDLSCGNEILSVDLENVCHMYRFSTHALVNGKYSRRQVLARLSDENYIKLVALYLDDNSMNMNKLKYADKDLYKVLETEIDSSEVDEGFFSAMAPFLVEMDEVKSDMEEIFKTHPEFKSPGIGGYIF